MRPFEYAHPTTKEQAVALLASAWGDTEILAGGTDLLALMKDDIVRPKRVVDIKGIKELQGISYSASRGLRIGALVTLQELLDHPEARRYPALVAAAEGVRSPQIRNRGTVGGDLCQRPRCWYFRAGFGLLARDESGRSLVLEGDNRYHAILGTDGPAYFVNPSSLAPALIAYGARVRIFGPRGAREVPLEAFYRAPRSETEREYDLRSNELVTEVLIPPPTNLVSATYEVRQREALDWPLATASVALRMSGQRIESARVVLGHVAPVPWRSAEAERVLVGKTMSDALADEAARAAVAPAKPLSQNAYKIQLARVAVKRALVQAARGGAR
ncbi:MAG TPA: xanthine dehydrogenase family protein subunit M [Blastocatellia bacterium]|nr:xanthine dehydrogenase family protein subunit M [Blastocatellia bacterium]